MNTLANSLFICLITTLQVFESVAQPRATILAAIRKDFQAINADKTLSGKKLGNEEFLKNTPDGGGELNGYYKNRNLVKIVEWIGFSYGNRTREFYLKNGKLFFVYEKFESFVVKDSLNAEIDHSKVTTTFEGRYYINRDKLIEQKISGKRTFNEDSVTIKELVDAARENARLLKQAG
jgi:hypothetical protein